MDNEPVSINSLRKSLFEATRRPLLVVLNSETDLQNFFRALRRDAEFQNLSILSKKDWDRLRLIKDLPRLLVYPEIATHPGVMWVVGDYDLAATIEVSYERTQTRRNE